MKGCGNGGVNDGSLLQGVDKISNGSDSPLSKSPDCDSPDLRDNRELTSPRSNGGQMLMAPSRPAPMEPTNSALTSSSPAMMSSGQTAGHPGFFQPPNNFVNSNGWGGIGLPVIDSKPSAMPNQYGMDIRPSAMLSNYYDYQQTTGAPQHHYAPQYPSSLCFNY